MSTPISRLFLIVIVMISFAMASAQTRPVRPKPRATPIPDLPKPDEMPAPEEPQNIETLKTDTDLVTVPVIATDSNGKYVGDLLQNEFTVFEDGVQQEVAFFAKTSVPFHVVLMLDTSASTQEKLNLIQQSAYTFVQQLQTADRVKIVSFDDVVRDLNEFTSDRNVLKDAINKTRSGQGTKVYDAMTLALNSLRNIKGRRAIVIFTDGVDWHSDDSTFAGTVRWLDEEGVIIYPIRYDTRAATERIAREQSNEITPQLPTIGVLRAPPTGTTAPTFPGDDSTPTSGTSSKTGVLGLPSASEILRRRREQDRSRDPSRDPNIDPSRNPVPDTTDPTSPKREPRLPGSRPDTGIPGSDPYPPVGTGRRAPRPDDSITTMLDMAYATADSYLKTLADKTGGRLLRADTLGSLPDAFAKVAAELRTQYSIGYYPLNKERDERYRRIKVSSTRKDVLIRARPGYLATSAR
jgi:von Willebrand factor type A domain